MSMMGNNNILIWDLQCLKQMRQIYDIVIFDNTYLYLSRSSMNSEHVTYYCHTIIGKASRKEWFFSTRGEGFGQIHTCIIVLKKGCFLMVPTHNLTLFCQFWPKNYRIFPTNQGGKCWKNPHFLFNHLFEGFP